LVIQLAKSEDPDRLGQSHVVRATPGFLVYELRDTEGPGAVGS
jgi:hypothetical protein